MNNEIERLKAENEKLKAENKLLKKVGGIFYRAIIEYLADCGILDVNAEPLKTKIRFMNEYFKETEEPTVPEPGKAETGEVEE